MVKAEPGESWRIVAPIITPAGGVKDLRYPGLTELTVKGRSFACIGTGARVENALREHVEREVA